MKQDLPSRCLIAIKHQHRKIFEQGVHHISKPLEEFYQAEKVDWNIARIFQYRKCQDSRALMQLKCSAKFEVDKAMQRFRDQLLRNLEFVPNAINRLKLGLSQPG